MAGGPVTLLFTDLVDSTALLERVGDEQAQRVFGAHHRLLRDAVTVHGGHEVKWLGDGLMTTFGSSADAVRCAVAMQQTTRGRAAGERLAMRAGLHVGEALRDESDWVGASVVVARRLCDRAAAGQILCSGLVVELLNGRRAFQFGEVGSLALKGLAAPVVAYEVEYDRDDPAAVLRHTPFTGRGLELGRLERRLEEARGGRGGVAMLVGEPGIGKTRTLEEFAETARAVDAVVLWGRCYEGEAARPYGPFAEALTEYARATPPDLLRADLGVMASPLSPLVPALRECLPDLPAPVRLQPGEERARLIDAVTQALLAVAARKPVVLILDDLHWADPGTVGLLRHVARFAGRGRLLVLGAYRDVEVDRAHPLAEALGTMPRETTYDQLALAGLVPVEVQDLMETLAAHEVAQEFVATVTSETSGNPFFLRALLLHLVEEGTLVRGGERWSTRAPPDRLVLPETVRQVIERRLDRLSERASRLLRVAAACSGGIDFEVVRRVAGMEEPEGLDALDEALAAQLLVASGDRQAYAFTHALVRYALYDALSPARQVRLHRQIAEAMEAVYGARSNEHATEIGYHYHRSASLAGAERGVAYCLAAADQAQEAVAFGEVAAQLRAALDLLPAASTERPRLLSRLALALIWALEFDEAQIVAREAARVIAETEGPQAAANYVATVIPAMYQAGHVGGAWNLAAEGLSYTSGRHDLVWAILMGAETQRRQASDPDNPGVLLGGGPEFDEVNSILAEHGLLEAAGTTWAQSREDILARAGGSAGLVSFSGGEIRRGLDMWEEAGANALQTGQIANAVACNAAEAFCHIALGNFAEASAVYERAIALAQRLSGPSAQRFQLLGATHARRFALDVGWEEGFAEAVAYETNANELFWLGGALRVGFALGFARVGQVEAALGSLDMTIPAVERAPAWSPTYPGLVCDAIEVLWLLERREHLDVLERNLREKVLEPDFRSPLRDARLALARLCALQGRYDEAIDWFARARPVLDEQGQRPLRAIVDYDEALMYARRGAPGDTERARPLLAAALEQFRTLGMPGWIRRGEALRERCDAPDASAPAAAEVVETPPDAGPAVLAPAVATLRQEGDYWAVAYQGAAVARLKDMQGFHYLVHLLRHPGQEVHVLDLIRQRPGAADGEPELARAVASESSHPLLDDAAKAAYRRRLEDLREQLAEAERCNDAGRAEQAREEIEALTQQLAAAVGLGGRDRAAGIAAERARSAVTQRLRAAIQRIARRHPALADHLSARVRTGTFCVYEPDPGHPITWNIDET